MNRWPLLAQKLVFWAGVCIVLTPFYFLGNSVFSFDATTENAPESSTDMEPRNEPADSGWRFPTVGSKEEALYASNVRDAVPDLASSTNDQLSTLAVDICDGIESTGGDVSRFLIDYSASLSSTDAFNLGLVSANAVSSYCPEYTGSMLAAGRQGG